MVYLRSTIMLALFCLLPAGAQAQDNALHMAVVSNDVSQVETLLQAGVNVNATAQGATPLMLASTRGNTQIIRLLLRNNARIDQSNKDGNTALIMAIMNSQPEAVRVLVSSNASLERKNNRGMNALEIAELMGDPEIEKILKANQNPDG